MTTDQISATVLKPPAAERFHAVNIADWLAAGESVTAVTVTAGNAALLVDRASFVADPARIRWRVRGGVADQDYIVTVTVTTNLERKEPVFIRYRVRQPEGAAA